MVELDEYADEDKVREASAAPQALTKHMGQAWVWL